MKKTFNKIWMTLIALAASVCLLFGVLCIESKTQTPALAESVASTTWGDYWGQGLTATDDTETGYTHFTHSSYGERMYYKEKVALDGLTVTLGAENANMVSQTRFGFGLVSDAGVYSPESGGLNVTMVPSWTDGQNCVFFNSSHANGTVVYLTGTTTSGVCTVDGAACNRFISAPATTGNTTYSITFNYMGEHAAGYGEYWSATITLLEGATFRTDLTSATVDFLATSLNGALDDNGECYISAFGMDNGAFYIGVTTAEEKEALATVDSALTAYETARTEDSSVVSARRAAVAAIAALPTRLQASYQTKLAELDAIDGTWAVAAGSCSASYNTETGYTELNPNDWGQRLYHKEKVKLDGLTVTLGAENANMVSQSRFGFGLVSDAGDYSPGSGDFNVTIVPAYQYGMNCVYFNSSHEDGTVVYQTGTVTAGVYNVSGIGDLQFFCSSPATTGNTTYSITFNYMGQHAGGYGEYWSATITVEEGSTPEVNGTATASSVTVDFLASSLNSALDDNGECYISAFGMSGNGEFYIGLEEASESSAIKTAEDSIAAYEEAVRSGVDIEAKREEALTAVESLSTNKYLQYAYILGEVEEMEEEVASLGQSMSLTVTDGLTLNYKIAVPESFGEVDSVSLVLTYRDEEFVYEDIQLDDAGRYVFQMAEITPQYMSENISFVFSSYDANGDLCVTRATENYSVKTYCETLLASTGDYSLITAIVDMLNYGAAAQAYVSNANTLANAGIDGYQNYASVADPASAENVLAANQSEIVTFTSATLVLEEKVSVCARFSTKEAYGVSRITATAQIGSDAAESVPVYEGTNGTYYVLRDGLMPTQYDKEVVFTISVDGTEYASCRYSVDSYVARNYNNSSCGALVKALYAYGVGMTAYANGTTSTTDSGNLLSDSLFRNGVKCYGTTAADQATDYTVYDTVVAGATPSWQLAQWDSSFDIQDVDNPTVENGVYTFTDGSAKTLQVNTATGGIYMEILGEAEYPTQDRQNSTDLWPHLLLQQEYFGSQLIQLSSLSSMNMKMTYTVTKLEDKMHGTVDEDLHRAQFVWYITLQNRNEESSEYGEYIWFGLSLYDNEDAGTQTTITYKVDDDTANNTGGLICLPGSADWSSTGKIPVVGQTVSVDYDILTAAQTAFNYAKNKGWFSDTVWSDIYIGSTNFGFELPGTYNVGVQIDEVGLIYTKA